MSVRVSQLVTDFISKLDAKEQEVIKGRYGLKDGVSKTLAELGEGYNVTRERIRQIEAGALRKVRKVMKEKGMAAFVDLIKTHLKNVGGVRRESLLLVDLKAMIEDPATQNLDQKLRFLLEVSGEPKFASENLHLHAHWYLTDEDKKKINNFIAKLVKLMEGKRSTTVSHKNIDSLLTDLVSSHGVKDVVALNYISASKQFHVNEYGDFGLSAWAEIRPKTVRDWAHLVLKKNQKPLHFSEIASMINKVRKDVKRIAHPQTVHNELIKDNRFVLVGRGTYGLQELGYVPGTAREVMARLLKTHGPLTPDELLSKVSQERLFKKNTVLINLQNKKYFKRLDDGKYHVTLV